MAKKAEQQAMLANMMSTFGGLAEQQRRETVKKEEMKKEEPKEVVQKVEVKPTKEEKLVQTVKEKENPKVVAVVKEELKVETKVEPTVKESKKTTSESKKKLKTPQEIIFGILAKGYDLGTTDEKRKQTSISLSEEAVEKLESAYQEMSRSIKLKKTDIIAIFLKDFACIYEDKKQKVLDMALDYNSNTRNMKTINWAPSTEMKEQLEQIIGDYGLNRLNMKYNMVCDMIIIHYLK